MFTHEFKVGSDWTLIASGVRNVGIQLDNLTNVRIHVSTAPPPDDAPGILLTKSIAREPSTFGISALPEGAQVYARSSEGGDSVSDLTVLAY